MRLDTFEYDLPADRIAQNPPRCRGSSRLLTINRADQRLSDSRFELISDLLRPGDCLVLNDTRVLPARFFGRRQTGGRIEGLFVRELEDRSWLVMLKSGGRLKANQILQLEQAVVELELIESRGGGFWCVRPSPPSAAEGLLEQIGQTPLPPYIKRDPDNSADPTDRRYYQTVYANKPGAVAAPTAGLHFTEELLRRIEQNRVHRAMVTLHVGPGTFQPITSDHIDQHKMHREWYHLSEENAQQIDHTRASGGRIVAVGTTTVRVLETIGCPLRAAEGWTDLFIRPGHIFRNVDAMITNFHLPRSTLLILVAAFAGYDLTMKAYEHAIASDYRFYSYGDAMWVE